MKIFFGKKFKEDFSDREFIESISDLLSRNHVNMVSIVRDYEKWGDAHITPEGLMEATFKAIDDADLVLIEFSEKGVGLGMEIGYAFSKNKPITIIAKTGSDISTTVQGVTQNIVFYNDIKDLSSKLRF